MPASGTTRKHFCIALNPSALAGRGAALDDSSGVHFKPALDPNLKRYEGQALSIGSTPTIGSSLPIS